MQVCIILGARMQSESHLLRTDSRNWPRSSMLMNESLHEQRDLNSWNLFPKGGRTEKALRKCTDCSKPLLFTYACQVSFFLW